MVILKQLTKFAQLKTRASSLVEVIVATVLIVLVLGIALFSINNVLENSIKRNTQHIESKLYELEYLFLNNNLTLPFYDEDKGWQISIKKDKYTKQIVFEATRSGSNKKVIKKLTDIEYK